MTQPTLTQEINEVCKTNYTRIPFQLRSKIFEKKKNERRNFLMTNSDYLIPKHYCEGLTHVDRKTGRS